MKSLTLLVALGGTLLCEASEVCRCAPQPLSDYFEHADEVVVGQLVTRRAVPETGDVDLTFRLSAAPHFTTRPDVFAGDTIVYRTASSSASCGVPAEMLSTFVLFASRPDESTDDEPWRIDTCSGSRVLLPMGGGEPGAFEDVPARFVPGQLNALASMKALEQIVAHWPDEADSDNERLVGLLDVASLSHAGFARLHEAPQSSANVVSEFDDYGAVRSREVGYEEPAAVVFSVSDGWYKLRLEDGRFGWLPPDMSGTYFPYPEVAVNRLNMIEGSWHGFVWPSPGAGIPVRAPVVPGRREDPVELHEVQLIGGSPWLRVTVLRASPCEGGDGTAAVSGWIPAYRTDGEPAVWYYSRGC
ncbi:MAG: hypothetical protein AAF389_21065 [Gemmatimonadota bacterium]